MLRILHAWAVDIPPRPVMDVAWDESWQCYTYNFPLSAIRIEEHWLKPTGDLDMTPEEWVENRRGSAMKPKNKAAQELVGLRWAKTTKEERSAHAKMMVDVREKKRRLKRKTVAHVA